MRAGRRDEITALFDKFQPQNVDVFISPVRVAYFRRAFRERGRVQHDNAVLSVFPFCHTQVLEHVRAYGVHVLKPVQRGVFKHRFNLNFRNIDGGYFLCDGCGVNRKSARVRETVQNHFVLCVTADCHAVFFLMQKISRLLPVSDVNVHFHAVFGNHDFFGHFAVQYALRFGDAFFFQHLRFAFFKNTFRMKQIDKALHDKVFPLRNAQRQTFHDKHVGVFVDNERGKIVAFGKHHTVRVVEAQSDSHIVGGFYAFFVKLFVVDIVVSDENSHKNFRQMIDISFPDIFFIVREDGGKTSVFILAFDFLHFVCIHPGMSRKYAPFFAFFQIYFVHIS